MATSYFSKDVLNNKTQDWRLIYRLIPFASPYKWLIFLSLIFALLVTAGYTITPWILGKIVDEGIKAKNTESLHKFISLYALSMGGYWLFMVAQLYSLQHIGQKVLYDLRHALFVHLHKLPLSFFDKNPVGRLVTRTTNDIYALSELFSSGLINVLGNILSLITIAVSMILLDPFLGVVTLSTAPLLFLAAWFLKIKMRKAFRLARQKLATVNASLSEEISGINVTHIFGQEKSRAKKFDTLNSELREAQLESVFYNSFFRPAVTIVNALTITLILAVGGYLVWKSEITIGVLVSFISYAQIFFYPIREISEKISIFQSSMAAAERVFGLLDKEIEPDLDVGENFHSIKHSLEFKNVNFSYTPDKPVLIDFNLKINQGEKLAIVGHTGAGKTTLASILKRFYEIDSGDIKFDDSSIKSFSKSGLRKGIALIQQDVFVYSGTIAENISLGLSEISESRLNEIIEELEMQSFIESLPQGLNTQIFEKGKNLSAGQRQLISFARALVFNPKLLILDEATSSMDSETETIIQKATEKLTENRTSIIIAHRLSTIKNCNRIIVLHKGKLVEQGTHSELIKEDGIYNKLYRIQFSENS